MTAEKGYVVEVDRSGCIAAAGAGKGASLGSAERRLYTLPLAVHMGERRLGALKSKTTITCFSFLLLLSSVIFNTSYPPSINQVRTSISHAHAFDMANNSGYYYSLPTEAPARSRSGSRRPPLTPSTVSSPCLTTLVPVASRRDSGTSGSPTKASTLLAKVVSAPPTPRETPAGSPLPSPELRMHSTPAYSYERPTVSRTESERYVRQYRKQDGYISFPDFEKFCQTENPYDQHNQNNAVKT